MSGPAMKWAMECAHDPLAPPLSAEKWLCVMLLAWKAGKTDNRIAMTAAEVAAMANLDKDVAARFVRELRAEGPLRDTGERSGDLRRTPIYEFICEWASDARAIALARQVQRMERHGRAKQGAGTVIKQGAGTVISDNPSQGAGTVANTVINDPLYIKGLQELPITPNKTKGDGARTVFNGVNGVDASQPLAGEASVSLREARPHGGGSNSGPQLTGKAERSCPAQAGRDACAASAYGGGDPMPSETPHPRTREPATGDDLVAEFRKLADEGFCTWPDNMSQLADCQHRIAELAKFDATVAELRDAIVATKARRSNVGAASVVRTFHKLRAGWKPEPVKQQVKPPRELRYVLEQVKAARPRNFPRIVEFCERYVRCGATPPDTPPRRRDMVKALPEFARLNITDDEMRRAVAISTKRYSGANWRGMATCLRELVSEREHHDAEETEPARHRLDAAPPRGGEAIH